MIEESVLIWLEVKNAAPAIIKTGGNPIEVRKCLVTIYLTKQGDTSMGMGFHFKQFYLLIYEIRFFCGPERKLCGK